jgi:hypothetical protein
METIAKPSSRKHVSVAACCGERCKGHIAQHYRRHEFSHEEAEALSKIHRSNIRFMFPQPTHPTSLPFKVLTNLLGFVYMDFKNKIVRLDNASLPPDNSPSNKKKRRKVGPRKTKAHLTEDQIEDEEEEESSGEEDSSGKEDSSGEDQ